MQRRKQLGLRLPAALLAAVALTAVNVSSADNGAGGYAIRNGSPVSGGGIVENDCFTLASTIGEPLPGSVSGGGFTVTPGFQATVGTTRITDIILKNGFDSLQGNCSP